MQRNQLELSSERNLGKASKAMQLETKPFADLFSGVDSSKELCELKTAGIKKHC